MEGLAIIVTLGLLSGLYFSEYEIVNENDIRNEKVITIDDDYGYTCKPTQKTIERLRVEEMEE